MRARAPFEISICVGSIRKRKSRMDVHRASLAHCLIREDIETWPVNLETPASYEGDLAELAIPNLDPD